jgi:hypothetical protein
MSAAFGPAAMATHEATCSASGPNTGDQVRSRVVGLSPSGDKRFAQNFSQLLAVGVGMGNAYRTAYLLQLLIPSDIGGGATAHSRSAAISLQ